LAYTKQLPGQLKRLSVAVLVDNARTTDDDGNVKETPLTAEQIESMTRLVKDSVGFSEKRGDSVSVVNSSFHPADEVVQEPMHTVPLWEKPIIRDVAKILAGLIVVLILVLQVIRPMMKSLMAPRANTMYADAQLQPIQMLSAGGQVAMNYEQQIESARTSVQQDPRRVAQVVKGWVGQGE
jgi:flagellar M-ring protein FliF